MFNRPDATSRRSLLRTMCVSLSESERLAGKERCKIEPFRATQSRAFAIVRRM